MAPAAGPASCGLLCETHAYTTLYSCHLWRTRSSRNKVNLPFRVDNATLCVYPPLFGALFVSAAQASLQPTSPRVLFYIMFTRGRETRQQNASELMMDLEYDAGQDKKKTTLRRWCRRCRCGSEPVQPDLTSLVCDF